MLNVAARNGWEGTRQRLWEALQRDGRIQNKAEITGAAQLDRRIAADVAGYQVPPKVIRNRGFAIVKPRAAWDVVNVRREASRPSISVAEFKAAVRRGLRSAR